MAIDRDLMILEQAIFTSTASRTGQGYRVVAHSPGLAAEDKHTIATTSPSHNSMVDESEAAQGWAFYEMPTGRFCVAHTCHAGHEQTARGGRRVLTQAFAVTPEQLREVENNPFAIIRELERSGVLTADFDIAGAIEPVTIAITYVANPEKITGALASGGCDGTLYMLERAMDDGCTIVAGFNGHADAIEAALLCMPVDLRTACNFAIGLKFTLGRRRRLHFIGDDTKDVKRIIRGQKVTLIEGDFPAPAMSPWQRMVRDCIEHKRLDDLLELNRYAFAGASNDTLDRAARKQIELIHVAERSIEQQIDLLAPDKPEVSEGVEGALHQRIVLAARADAIRKLRAASTEVVQALWVRLTALAEADEDLKQLCLDLFEMHDRLNPPPPGYVPPEPENADESLRADAVY